MRTTNAALTGAIVGLVTGSVLMAYATSPSPRKDRYLSEEKIPEKVERMDISANGLERVIISRTEHVVKVSVWYDGVERGKLIEFDLHTRTMVLPYRPPVYWSIGSH